MVDPVGALVFRAERLGRALQPRVRGRSWLGRAIVDALLLPSDIWHIRQRHRSERGTLPRLIRPRAFDDWIQHLKLFSRRARRVRMVDKIASRDIVAERAGEAFVMRPLWTGHDIDDAPFDSLPQGFAIKSSHGSGQFILVEDKATLDRSQLRETTRQWLAQDHSAYFGEWPYRWVEPRLLIEPLVTQRLPGPRIEYLIWCIRGRCELIQVEFDQKTDRWQRLFFDRDLRPLDIRLMRRVHTEPFAFSPHIHRIIEASEQVAADEVFLRVDVFDSEPPIIGELTLSPRAGVLPFEPSSVNDRLGDLMAGRPAVPLDSV